MRNHSFTDITGNKYGRLTVLNRLPNKNGRMRWLCQCDCGNRAEVRGEHLKNLATRSCGCLDMERMTIHGMARTPEYHAWQSLKNRCYCPTDSRYRDYGGRGIRVCESWLQSFENFYADMGNKPSRKYSIDRIDNNGDYSRENCRWTTHMEQINNRRNTRRATIKGVTKPVKQWCAELGTDYQTALKRIKRGIPPEIAVTAKGHSLRGKVFS